MTFLVAIAAAQAFSVRTAYVKREVMIPMRDGTKLYTAVFEPKDRSKTYPFLMVRTPYGCQPYGPDRFPNGLGPTPEFAKRGYIFVNQDVRGRWMSEGKHLYSPPPKPNKQGTEFDESTDAYDTVEWLLKNVPNHNGRVGIWGISQPGYYASNALIDAHPAIKAVSPQAPVTDRFKGDDDHHNGAFFLAQRVSLLSSFGAPRPIPTDKPADGFRMPYADAYRYFLELGPLANYQKIFRWSNQFWNWETTHPNYDEFWQPRGMERSLKNVHGPAVLTVGGWFDAEDMWGALHTYRALESQNPGLTNTIVMGPWFHGGWTTDAERLGAIEFGSKTGQSFKDEVILPFFERYLRDGADPKLPEAYVFETGTNKWHSFDQWPPREATPQTLYLQPHGKLGLAPSTDQGMDSYVCDPRRPTPYTAEVGTAVNRTFMVENQRFAWARPDVLSYTSEPLAADLTLAGPMIARLMVKTTGTDADYVVKLIDVYPDDAADNREVTPTVRMAGYQMLVRWEIMRARFRESLSQPKPLVPGKLTEIKFDLNDLFHTFRKGHRLMVQVQSAMFPLVDRNPQKFVPNIYLAKESDFQAATHTLAVGGQEGSRLEIRVLR